MCARARAHTCACLFCALDVFASVIDVALESVQCEVYQFTEETSICSACFNIMVIFSNFEGRRSVLNNTRLAFTPSCSRVQKLLMNYDICITMGYKCLSMLFFKCAPKIYKAIRTYLDGHLKAIRVGVLKLPSYTAPQLHMAATLDELLGQGERCC